MNIENTAIPDVKLIKPRRFDDGRGFFQQIYHEQQCREAGIDVRFVQDNWSRSTKGVLRGLHYQRNHAQDKLVSVIRGEVFDVAVDIRKGSPTFGKWVGKILSEENDYQLFIPKGFAHGFCVLSEGAHFSYKCSDYYDKDDQCGIIWNDKELNINWPNNNNPIISDKDNNNPSLIDIMNTL